MDDSVEKLSGRTKKLPRIAILISQNTVSEYANSLEHILVGLADQSIQTVLVCPPKARIKSIIPTATEIIRYPAVELPLTAFQNKKIVLNQLRNFGITLIHCMCEELASLTRWLSHELDIPYAITINSIAKRVKKRIICQKRCRKIIVPAETIKKGIKSTRPDVKDNIELIKIGTFVDRSSKCFSGPDHISSIVVTHPLNKLSDFDKVLGAAKHLLIDGYDFMLFIIGGGKQEQKIRNLIQSLGLGPKITIVPSYAPWRWVLGVGDIYLQPVPQKKFNPLMLEAMGLGSLVVSCKGGVDDLVMEDKTAFTFESDDELSLYSTLREVLDDKQKSQRIAASAQQYLRDNHSVSNMVEKLLDVYINFD